MYLYNYWRKTSNFNTFICIAFLLQAMNVVLNTLWDLIKNMKAFAGILVVKYLLYSNFRCCLKCYTDF